MFNTYLREELTRAQGEHSEVELLLEGRTVFPSLLCREVKDESVQFVDADGSTITVITDALTGVIVHEQSPPWMTRGDIDVRGRRTKETVRS